MTSARKRVIAGVTGTLTDLQALRVAVDSARERDAVLHAACPVLVVPAPEMAHDLDAAVRRARRLTRVPADGTV